MKGNWSARRWRNRLLATFWTRLRPWARAYARWGVAGDAGPVPWSEPRASLGAATVALVTTAGVHLPTDPPFDMASPLGDASFRVVPGGVATADLVITHDYYDHRAADRDPNTVFPLDRLRELAAAGLVGRVAPRHVGAMGHLLGVEHDRLRHATAPAVARLLVDDGVDYAVLSPG
jgi:D-proline reductase (dithiol) PrdB